MRGGGAFLAILFALAAPASADWQFTKWGMTVDQVIAVSKGTAHKVPYNRGANVWGLDLGAEGNYAEGAISFKSEFYFDSRGALKIVRTTPLDLGQCPALKKAVEAKYGKPADTSLYGKKVVILGEYWPDKAAQNAVRYTQTTVFDSYMGCFVAYVPLSVVDDKGYPHFQ